MNGPWMPSASPWIAAIGWMLLHSLWQGAGVAVALGVVLCGLRRAPARARYLAACLGMIAMVALPVASLRQPLPRLHPEAAARPSIRVTAAPGTDSAPVPESLRLTDRLEPMLPAIVAAWLAGVVAFSMRLLGGWLQARRWVRQRTRPLGDLWPARVERLKERLGVRRAVALLESAWVEVPMVVGWLRPAILVPVAALLGLSAAELEAILAHELAHIRRHDDLVNLLQCVVEVLMFYHPAAWWTSRVIRREREACCDDLAVAVCRDRVVYARALAALEGLRTPAFFPSTAASGGVLLARVRRVLNPQEESMNPVRIFAGLAAVLAVVPLWLARAGDESPAPPRPAEAAVPFPNRSFADLITALDEAPTGRFLAGPASDPDGPPDRPKKRRVVSFMLLEPGDGDPNGPADRPKKRRDWPVVPYVVNPYTERPKKRRSVPVAPHVNPSGIRVEPIPEKPPTEAEVWAEFLKSQTDSRPYYETRRDNVRIVVGKTSKQVMEGVPRFDSIQLLHRYYPCTVSYDETRELKAPIPLRSVDHKVEVLSIDRPIWYHGPNPERVAARERVEARIDRLSRDIEVRKRTASRDRLEQDPVYNRMIGELEGLRYLREEWKAVDGASAPKRR